MWRFVTSERVADMDQILRGRTVFPTNADYNDPGGIHDDATAQELGFRGGTIAGSAHLDTFVPLLLQAFGDEWFRSGSLSIYFRHATTDGEPTEAFVELPENVTVPASTLQARVWISTPDGTVIGEGTASVGVSPEGIHTALGQRDLRHDPANARILAGVERGQVLGPESRHISAARVAHGCDHRITEPLDWYRQPSPWGGPIAPPSALIDLYSQVAGNALLAQLGSAVGMWGALEVRFHDGPLVLDADYDVEAVVASVSDSPKTEILWFDAFARQQGRLVASGRVLSRFVKSSSPLYADSTRTTD